MVCSLRDFESLSSVKLSDIPADIRRLKFEFKTW